MRVRDKVVIVTGAGGGFGEGIAHRLADEGARVIVADIRADAAQAVAGAIASGGRQATAVACDVTCGDDWQRLVQAALDRHGRLDVVVNNAGWTHRNQPCLDVTEAEFDRVHAVNVKSLYWSVRHAVPVFRAQGGGAFVNIASTAGVRPRPGLTWYNGSKGAVIVTSRSLAAELGPDNIRVNCVNPVMNPFTGLGAAFAGGEPTEERLAKFRATIPLGRFSTALDVAHAVLFLASDEAAFISGACLEVDGARCV